jgi:hypothetical protein
MKQKRNYRYVAYNDAPKGQPQPRRSDPDMIPSSPSVLAGANCNVRPSAPCVKERNRTKYAGCGYHTEWGVQRGMPMPGRTRHVAVGLCVWCCCRLERDSI